MAARSGITGSHKADCVEHPDDYTFMDMILYLPKQCRNTKSSANPNFALNFMPMKKVKCNQAAFCLLVGKIIITLHFLVS